jgi:hypothetical protein
MTRDEARKAAAVMLAYAEGKNIQYKTIGTTPWQDAGPSGTDLLCFDWGMYRYRIKPQVVRYRRILWKTKNGEPRVAVVYGEDEIQSRSKDSSFVRFIDTEWQEEEV